MIRVLLADDQVLLVDGLRVILDADPEITVVAAAYDGAAALELARLHHPDIVLCDLRMPGMDGVEATRRITSELPDTRVVVLTTYDHDDLVLRALQAGAAAYLLKDLPARELVHAVRAVAGGQTILQPASARMLLGALSQKAPGQPDASGAAEAVAPEHLTGRELEVLRLMAEGRRNREIAAALFVSEATVKTHVNNIFAKLGCHDRAQAIVRAMQQGLIRAPAE